MDRASTSIDMQRMASDEAFMRMAMAAAVRAGAMGEVPVGAVVVLQGKVIATGFNRPIAGHDPSAHAEMMALREASATLENYRLPGCEIYVTLEPCVMCAGAIMHSRISRVIFGAADPKTGACGSVLNLFENERLNHHAQVTSGILATECGQLLTDFFRDRRNRSNRTD